MVLLPDSAPELCWQAYLCFLLSTHWAPSPSPVSRSQCTLRAYLHPWIWVVLVRNLGRNATVNAWPLPHLCSHALLCHLPRDSIGVWKLPRRSHEIVKITTGSLSNAVESRPQSNPHGIVEGNVSHAKSLSFGVSFCHRR